MLMSTKFTGCDVIHIFFNLLWVRYNCAKFHHSTICVTDFREGGGLFALHPWAAPKKSILNRVNRKFLNTNVFLLEVNIFSLNYRLYFKWQNFYLKKLQKYILRTVLAWSSFFTIRVYLSLHFLIIIFGNYFFVLLCFMCVLFAVSSIRYLI